MTPERWKQVNDLFHAALERSDQEAFVREATRGDAELRREVESLLASHRQTGDRFLETPAWGVEPELALGDAALRSGRMLGNYRILHEIGRGGMGVIYAAEDTRLGRQVALKALAPQAVSDPAGRERLRREARAAAALTHPSIATVYALEEFEGDLFIASELVHGRTLREELHEGPLPAERLRTTLLGIAEGLAAAHAAGIVHRDLKPENVMRTTDDRVKILDFGLARVSDAEQRSTITRLTQAGAAAGTPGYMAPEQWSGGTIDARTDIFAFGILATELATGAHPFGQDSATLLVRRTRLMEGRTLSTPGTWSAPELQAVAKRCLRADPHERYASGAELVEALRAATATNNTVAAAADRSLWWWQFHQIAVAIVLAAMPASAYMLRLSLQRPRGSWLFFVALVLATVSITVRMHLLFTSRVHPEQLADQRGRAFPWVGFLDASLALLMLAVPLSLAGQQDEIAVLPIVLAAIILVSIVLIEPATTRAAGIR